MIPKPALKKKTEIISPLFELLANHIAPTPEGISIQPFLETCFEVAHLHQPRTKPCIILLVGNGYIFPSLLCIYIYI